MARLVVLIFFLHYENAEERHLSLLASIFPPLKYLKGDQNIWMLQVLSRDPLELQKETVGSTMASRVPMIEVFCNNPNLHSYIIILHR